VFGVFLSAQYYDRRAVFAVVYVDEVKLSVFSAVIDMCISSSQCYFRCVCFSNCVDGVTDMCVLTFCQYSVI